MEPITPEQSHMIRHALGLTYKPTPYRNHYCTTDADPALEAMVEAGWMRRGATLNAGRDRYYIVTPSGASAVGASLPTE